MFVVLYIRNPRLWNTVYTSQGIRNPSNDWNPESRFRAQRIRKPVPGIRNLWRGMWNPESQTVLDSLTCCNTSAFVKATF